MGSIEKNRKPMNPLKLIRRSSIQTLVTAGTALVLPCLEGVSREDSVDIYFTESKGADPQAHRAAWEQFERLVARSDRKLGAILAHSKGDLAALGHMLSDQELKALAESALCSRTQVGNTYKLQTPLLANPFSVGGYPVFAACINPDLLLDVADDARVSAIVYVPWMAKELAQVRARWSSAIQIPFTPD